MRRAIWEYKESPSGCGSECLLTRENIYLNSLLVFKRERSKRERETTVLVQLCGRKTFLVQKFSHNYQQKWDEIREWNLNCIQTNKCLKKVFFKIKVNLECLKLNGQNPNNLLSLFK